MKMAAACKRARIADLAWPLFVLEFILSVTFATAAFSQAQSNAKAGKTPPPKVREITPNVATAGSNPLTVHIHGRYLAGLSKVTVTNCDRTRVDLPVKTQEANTFTFDLPAALLSKPCVLRVSTEFQDDLPLGVSDPQTAKLKVPAYDPDASPGWGGMFNYVFDAGQPVLPNSDDAIVGINFTDPIPRPVFVLGKNDTALFQLKVLPRGSNDQSDKSTLVLWLPGVRVRDVQWGPKDVENFWLGTLSTDGSQIVFRQALADMVQEPAGTPDTR